ncbi:prepilin peptidase [Streptomyces sp. NPDC091272]|uniref:prepilin peptidase n=1 Tax=Streptomyces sp. NPDC091272 TaxID=3365981 RepID=UPI0037FDA35D
MPALLIVAAALWGALAGLLLPRAAYRLSVEPQEPWRDACPAGHPFGGLARGWLGTGRCAPCAAGAPAPLHETTPPVPYEKRHDDRHERRPDATSGPHPLSDPPAVSPPGAVPRLRTLRYAVLCALACAVLALATGARPELVVWLLLAPFALLLAVVDRRVQRLPDVLTLPLAAAALVLLAGAALLPGGAGSWVGALLGGAGLGGAYFLLFLVNPNGMGFGDVKLALAIGVVLGWYGWPALFLGASAGFVLGALYGVGLMVTRRGGRKTAIPFGPFMIAGAWVGLVLGGAGVA